jgi:hypothetical protein
MVYVFMKKTSIDVPDDRVAPQDAVTPRPRVSLLDRGLGDATIAENVDALLDGERFSSQ